MNGASGARSYPLVNYEYVVVSTKQASPEMAATQWRFLLWAIVPSETKEGYLGRVHFVPLPPHLGTQPGADPDDPVDVR